MLAEAIKFPLDIPEFEDIVEDEIEPGNLVRYNPLFDYNVIPDEGYYTQFAYSYTDPVAYYPFMTADTYILKKVGFHWETSRFKGETKNNAHDLYVTDGPFTLSTGTYRQKAHFSGVRDDYSQYSEDFYRPQFSV